MRVWKALLEGDCSGYDKGFIYSRTGWTKHPNPDRASQEVCGRGLHLVKSLLDIPNYVDNPKWVFLAHYREKLGGDDFKIRVAAVKLVLVVEWAKLKLLYDDYVAKRKLLYDDYVAELKPLYDDYVAKRKLLYDDYVAELKPLYDDYQAKWEALAADYQAKLRKRFFRLAVPV